MDIDTQAVEVTKLSLLLKVLEGENEESINTQLLLLHERALPDLAGNIKCGNSLIGPDFYKDRQLDMFNQEQRLKINAFDWHAEFPQAFKDGGFDAVIGNPPYVNAWGMFEDQPKVREYIATADRFQTADRHWDLYVAFLEQALRLLREKRRMAFIIPYSWAIQKYAMLSRRLFLENTTIESVADLRSLRVFGTVPVITIIPCVVNDMPNDNHEISIYHPAAGSTKYVCAGLVRAHSVCQHDMPKQHESMLRIDLSADVSRMISRMEARSFTLDDICYINYGAQMSSKAKGKFGKDHVTKEIPDNPQCHRMISGRDLYRYRARWSGKYVDYSFAGEMYGPRWPEFFETQKLMIRDITGTHRIEATLDRDQLYCDHTVLCAVRKCDIDGTRFSETDIAKARQYDLRYLAGVIASRALSAYCYFVLTGEGVRIAGGFHTYPHTIRRFPIPKLDPANKRQRGQQNRIIEMVERMLQLHKDLPAAKTPNEKDSIQRQITATDNEIDQLVYELYGLTDDEIRIVEAHT